MKAINLKPGDKLTIADIEMEFSYWSGKNPAFVHEVNGVTITYINKKYTKETLISEIK